MPSQRGPQFAYSESQMEAAILAVNFEGMTRKGAARKFNVPRSTLQDKLTGRTQIGRKMGKDPYLSEDQENEIVDWILRGSQKGFPPKTEDVLNTVQRLIRSSEPKIKNPFKDDRPGKTWFRCFMKRHPNLPVRTSGRGSKAILDNHADVSLRTTGEVSTVRGAVVDTISTTTSMDMEIADDFINDRTEESILQKYFARFRHASDSVFNIDDTEFNDLDRDEKCDKAGGLATSSEITAFRSVNPVKLEKNASPTVETVTTANSNGSGIAKNDIFQYGLECTLSDSSSGTGTSRCESPTPSEQIAGTRRFKPARETSSVKRRKTEKVDDLLSAALTRLTAMQAPKNTAFAAYICEELDSMSNKQALLAKKYINNILYLGNCGQLHDNLF